MELKEYNKIVYDEYLNLNNLDSLSSPLLVSSNRYLDNICSNPIMYIGQETNGWVNDDIDNPTLNDIESYYDGFLIDYKTSKSTYWQFIKNIISSYDELYKNIIWVNTLLVGNKNNIGYPIIDNDIRRLSLEYLLFIYNYFKPSYIINVSGSNNPYYYNTIKFLDTIGIKINCPTNNEPIVISDNYIWTYHPKYLRFSGKENMVLSKIKNKLTN